MSSQESIVLPSFICIGAQRAGTTWLYHCLKEHPEVFMPEVKELRFFNYNYEEGLESYGRFFEGAEFTEVRGEVTPDYYRQEYALRRIKKHLPNVKLIFVLRNPIDRAYSQYELYHGTEYKELSFEQTYKQYPDIIEWGMYGKHLDAIYELFPKENLLILEYDLLQGNPEAFLQQVFGFLGVAESFRPESLDKTFNKVIFPRLQRILNVMGMNFIIELVKSSLLGDWIKEQKKKKSKAISSKDFNYLAHRFKDDITKLELILDTDLSHWFKD